ncbi:OmpH family outer membrane protein [Roseivivax isoporae]|nr:OmpH family outer membrane protein [Roseivivax isoporae]
MRRLRAIALALAFAGAPFAAGAQEGAQAPVVRSAILTVETERLFAESAFGMRVEREIEEAGQALASENREIEAELTAEEQRLTEQRASMDPAAFRAAADAFDVRVQELRQQQDAKARALSQRTEQARRRFLSAVQPVLADIMREAGAAVILERRAVLVSLDATDITGLAIERIDAAIGDGSDLEPLDDE